MVFKAKGRDSLTKMKIGEWKWSYNFRDLGEKRTEILITYEWSPLMDVLSLFTVKHQAANELTETVLSLDSLEYLSVKKNKSS